MVRSPPHSGHREGRQHRGGRWLDRGIYEQLPRRGRDIAPKRRRDGPIRSQARNGGRRFVILHIEKRRVRSLRLGGLIPQCDCGLEGWPPCAGGTGIPLTARGSLPPSEKGVYGESAEAHEEDHPLDPVHHHGRCSSAIVVRSSRAICVPRGLVRRQTVSARRC
jgi:hypothetical protein